jgi:hypothetical protein
MSEKIYRWLLRLYPSQFRQAHGHEALQLFRDRACHEKGFFPRLRLWLDLLADLAVSLPREYGYDRAVLVSASVYQRSDGIPFFFQLGGELPRPGALFSGAALSLTALAIVWLLLGHGGNYAAAASSGQWLGDSHSSGQQFWQPKESDVTGPRNNTAIVDPNLAAAERKRIVDAAVANLKAHYVDRDVAVQMADALLAHEQRGDDDGVLGNAFADLLTAQMRDVSHDMHLEMVYSEPPLPNQPSEPTAEELLRYRTAMVQNNCTFEKVAILPHNIGYLKLNSFPDTSVCQPMAVAAMACLNHVDAVIFDLRDNAGGNPNMVSFVASYLFDHPEYMYNPRENISLRSWTSSPVPGNSLADKPVYILTSSSTWSGAEQFCYDLKMLKRATLVGQTTRGGAHSGTWYRIDDHYGMGIPETRPINPFSDKDWAGIGVAPDVKVEAATALTTAEELAGKQLRKK